MKFKGNEIKACIFDLDGTLLDSCSIWKEVDERFFEKRGMQVPSDYSKEIGPLGLDKASEYTIKRFNLKEKKEDIINEWCSAFLIVNERFHICFRNIIFIFIIWRRYSNL